MWTNSFKSFVVAAFSLFSVLFTSSVFAQHEHAATPAAPAEAVTAAHEGAEEKFNPGESILHHIADSHEFHFFDIKKENGETFHATMPLPIIVYAPQRGFSMFSSSNFHHGTAVYNGYKLDHDHIVAVDANGNVDESVKVYDFSITKNVFQLLLSVIILLIIAISAAKKYAKGQGVTSAPKGMQNAFEAVVLFIRDDVAKPNLSGKYKKYMPYLLTIFFFILVNALVGLLPNAASVTGNIGFTLMLGITAFVAIMISTNKHYWGHIFWFPGVPTPVKFIMMPVELLGVFTKPFALIVRLFANMTAGHIIILSFISLIFIFAEMSKIAGGLFSPVSVAFAVFIYAIEILVAFIQAYIFTVLTAVFIGGAIGDHHFEEDIDTSKIHH